MSRRADRLKIPSFEWDFGFKVALGYQFPRDLVGQWRCAATSLQTHADRLTRGEGLIPLWLSKPLLVDSAKMHWRLHLGVFDVLLFRKFAATETLMLQPQIGISGTIARQKFSVDYGSSVEVRTKNKFFGIGPYLGLFTQWLLKRGAFLFAEVGFRDLYGEFYLHQDEDLLHTKEKVLGVHNVYRQGASALEMLFGFGWDSVFFRVSQAVWVSTFLGSMALLFSKPVNAFSRSAKLGAIFC